MDLLEALAAGVARAVAFVLEFCHSPGNSSAGGTPDNGGSRGNRLYRVVCWAMLFVGISFIILLIHSLVAAR